MMGGHGGSTKDVSAPEPFVVLRAEDGMLR